jgi:hypothetical protein
VAICFDSDSYIDNHAQHLCTCSIFSGLVILHCVAVHISRTRCETGPGIQISQEGRVRPVRVNVTRCARIK